MQMPSSCTASEVRCVKGELLCMEISRLSVTLQMKDVWCVTAELGGLLWVENISHTQNAHTHSCSNPGLHCVWLFCLHSFGSAISHEYFTGCLPHWVRSSCWLPPSYSIFQSWRLWKRPRGFNQFVWKSKKKSALVFFCWHYSNLVSFLSPGYTWNITQWFIFKSGSIFSPFSGPHVPRREWD